MKVFALKFIVLVILLSISIFWIESAPRWSLVKESSPLYNYARWNAFYDFTENANVDVLILGNSRSYNGINPKKLSLATNSNCFILGSAGSTITNSYYTLKEALKRTKPKMVILETWCINHNIDSNQKLSYRYKSFSSKKDLKTKIFGTPDLFPLNLWPMAWLKSVRNHNELFKKQEGDKLALKKELRNMEEFITKGRDGMYAGKYKLYLGKYNGNNGLTEKTLKRYRDEGPPQNLEKHPLTESCKIFVKKMHELCEEQGIELMFLTIPQYYMHIKGYEAFKEKQNKLIAPTGRKWLDLQLPYDTARLTPDCFDDTYLTGQHTTAIGSFVCTNLLVSYLNANFKGLLPNRSGEEAWQNTFYDEPGYLFTNDVKEGDKKNFVAGPFNLINNVVIEKVGFSKISAKGGRLWAQAKTSSNMQELLKAKKLRVVLNIVNAENKVQNVSIDLPYNRFDSDDNYTRYSMNIGVTQINQILQLGFID